MHERRYVEQLHGQRTRDLQWRIRRAATVGRRRRKEPSLRMQEEKRLLIPFSQAEEFPDRAGAFSICFESPIFHK